MTFEEKIQEPAEQSLPELPRSQPTLAPPRETFADRPSADAGKAVRARAPAPPAGERGIVELPPREDRDRHDRQREEDGDARSRASAYCGGIRSPHSSRLWS